jgi:3-oxoacyl-(acyl-carrier-protein) synthase
MAREKQIYITGMEVCFWPYGETSENLTEGIPSSMVRRMDEYSIKMVHAVRTALQDAGIEEMEELKNKKGGALFNTYWGPLMSTEKFFLSLIEDGAENVSPSLFPNLVTNASLGKVCKLFNIYFSTNSLIATAPIEYAMELMEERNNEYMIIAECDELYETNVAACVAAGVLSEETYKFKGSKVKAVGGYGAFLLEQLEDIKESKGKPYAQVLSSASIYAPMVLEQIPVKEASKRVVKVMQKALENARLETSQVETIVSFSNGSEIIENVEKTALETIFRNKMKNIKKVNPIWENGESFGEGLSMALKAGIAECQKQGMEEKAVMCCSYTVGKNVNVTFLKQVKTAREGKE